MTEKIIAKNEAVEVRHKVVLGWHDFGHVTGHAMKCALEAAIAYPGLVHPTVIRQQSCYVTAARNQIFNQMLENPDYADATHLLMFDADMGFPPSAIIQTAAAWIKAQPCDVLYGQYSLGDFASSFFGKTPDECLVPAPFDPRQVKPNQMMELYAAGTGWLYCSKDFIREFKERATWTEKDAWVWFGHDAHDMMGKQDAGGGKYGLRSSDGWIRMGEDLSFSIRCQKLGFKLKGYTGVPLVHQKAQNQILETMAPLLEATGAEVRRIEGGPDGLAKGSKDFSRKANGLAESGKSSGSVEGEPQSSLRIE